MKVPSCSHSRHSYLVLQFRISITVLLLNLQPLVITGVYFLRWLEILLICFPIGFIQDCLVDKVAFEADNEEDFADWLVAFGIKDLSFVHC